MYQFGFSLIEILVVMGLFALLMAMGVVFSLNSYQGYVFRTEYGNFTHVLAKARNFAVNNFDESQHGIHFELDALPGSYEYTLFVGNTYVDGDPSNQTFALNRAIAVAAPDDIVFEQLSGNLDETNSDCTAPCTITFTYAGKNEVIEINEIGAISW